MDTKTGNDRKVMLDKTAFKRGVNDAISLRLLVTLLKQLFGKRA